MKWRHTLAERMTEHASRIITRRRFLQGTATTVAGIMVGPRLLRAATPGQKLNIAFIGTGGRAEAHLYLAESENCVAYCDVDASRWGRIKGLAPKATGYTDWRLMFDKHLKHCLLYTSDAADE